MSVEGPPALGVTADTLPVLGCFKEHVFMAVADPSFNVSTRPVLKDTPCLANVSFGLSGLQNGLMGVFECCFSFGAVSP